MYIYIYIYTYNNIYIHISNMRISYLYMRMQGHELDQYSCQWFFYLFRTHDVFCDFYFWDLLWPGACRRAPLLRALDARATNINYVKGITI